MAHTIAIANGKGGVGKSSTAANVGGLLAAAGYRVLLVDLDPQGQLTEHLGFWPRSDEGQATLTAVLTGGPLVPVGEVRERLDVAAGGRYLDDLAGVMATRRARDGEAADAALGAALEPVAGDYDWVLIDCPPGGPVLQDLALMAARWVLIPVRTDAGSRKGLRVLGARFAAAAARHDLELLGVVLHAVTTGASAVRARARADIEADLGTDALVFAAWIRHAEAPATEAIARGRLVHELASEAEAQAPWYRVLRLPVAQRPARLPSSSSALADDYHALALELVDRLEQRAALSA